MRALVLLLALALSGCAQLDGATVPPSDDAGGAAASAAVAPPPARIEGQFVAGFGSAFAKETVAGSTGEFVVGPGTDAFLAVGNWSATVGTGAEMRIQAPSGEVLGAGSIGAMNMEGSEELRVLDPEPGTWRVEWSAAGAAAQVTWTVDVSFA